MKNKILIILSLFLFITGLSYWYFNIYIKNQNSNSKIITNETLLREKVFQFPEKYNKEEVDTIIKNVSKVPNKLIKLLIQNHVKARLIKGLVVDEPEYSGLKGTDPNPDPTSPYTCTWDDVLGIAPYPVLIRIGHNKPMHNDYSSVDLHEIGHAIDIACLDDIGTSQKFYEIYKEENKQLDLFYFDLSAETSLGEYFAETFSIYFYSKGGNAFLKRLTPKTYEFIKKLSST